MHDMNFFAAYKNKQAKGSTFRVFIIVLLVVFLLLNGALFGGGLYLFRQLQGEIDELQAYIDNPNTQDQIKQANLTRQQADLSGQYLDLVKNASEKLAQLDQVDPQLLDHLLSLTPQTTYYTFFEINGTQIMIECFAPVIDDPIDMYHAFQEDPVFSSVELAGITRSVEDDTVKFTLICRLAGGDPS